MLPFGACSPRERIYRIVKVVVPMQFMNYTTTSGAGFDGLSSEPVRATRNQYNYLLGYGLTRPSDAQVVTGFKLVTRT